jgi:hypothetical protein
MRNDLSWKSFLSTVTKNINDNEMYSSWDIYGKTKLGFKREVAESDLDTFNIEQFSAFYVTPEDIDILSKKYKINKSKDDSVVIPIKDFSLKGRKYNDLRTAFNKNDKRNFEIIDYLKSYDDMEQFLLSWDETSGEKHFQSRIGKNRFFFKKQFEREGISLFIYDEDKLIGWGVLSKPIDGYSAYVAGKALCYDYKGMSEYADIILYEYARTKGVEFVDLGGGKPSVFKYKMKFPKAYISEGFDINAKI